ncbi:hypothetical protein [Mycobacterium riyadhense]|uniref:hypothetical protein n=1 Tax=Mycobacterium riyadhense TaxID=486698 RepID=UPI002094DFC8|nr:hypothetical protein [Mycobacterium riyadhense]
MIISGCEDKESHGADRCGQHRSLRAYAFDVVNLARFLAERDVTLAAVDSPLVFDWIDWQGVRRLGRVSQFVGPYSGVDDGAGQ